MARYRRKRSYNGGGGGVSNVTSGRWAPFLTIVMGAVAMLVVLIMYGIALDSLDTAYTSAATYTEQTGLVSVMGIWPLVLFVVFMAVGLAAIGAGSYLGAKRAIGGSWMEVFMGVIMGSITIVIALLMNTTIQTQLHAVYTNASCTTVTANIASFSGLLNVMGIWGMVIFLVLMAAGIAQIAAAGYGSYKHLAGKMN